MDKILYIKTRTNQTRPVDVQEWSGTRYGRGWFITTVTGKLKKDNVVTNVNGKEEYCFIGK